jgi:hypothetical protein
MEKQNAEYEMILRAALLNFSKKCFVYTRRRRNVIFSEATLKNINIAPVAKKDINKT